MRYLGYRLFQVGMRIGSYVLPWRSPELLEGENSLAKLPGFLKSKGILSVLIITDKGIASLGLMDGLLKGLGEAGVDFSVYDKTVPNPTIDNIEEALQIYKEKNHQGIIAFGGGSPMDCAKGVGARAAKPRKTIPQMKGLFKVLAKLPPLVAIPTTSGTGSEATVAAVVTNPKTHDKYALMDLSLIPRYAVLDPLLTVKLPPHITSTTGMDALTHAVEAYIGKANTKQTKKLSIDATKLVFDNLYEAYSNGSNIEARSNMQKASHYAGIAFTRAYVGNVHAVAHALGGFYGTPHGLANAVVLPYVLEYYGKSVYKPLAELWDAAGQGGDSDEQKAKLFIAAVKALNERMNIPDKISGIEEKDIPKLAAHAFKEANPVYPVPVIFSQEDFANIYRMIKQ
jgi:alcohol dehydrogenase class IV